MVTLKDIAKASGVSTATVSYVVNGGPRLVLPETRERVLKVVEELGYHPNAAARSLMGKRTQTYGVVFPHVAGSLFDNQYFGAVLTGIIDAASERKQNSMLFTGMSWQEAERSVPLFCDGRCDGFVFVAPPPNSELVETLISRGTRVVVIGTRSSPQRVAAVDVDNVEGARMSTQYLLDLGHRRLGMFHRDSPSTSAPERIEGFRAAHRSRGIPDDEAPVFIFDRSQETAYDAALRLLQSREGANLTGLVCSYDSEAVQMSQAAAALGRRIPEDLSLIGFDDLPSIRDCTPPLSSVRQPLRQIGAAAALMLFDLIEDPDLKPTEKLFKPELAIRGSTGPPPVGR
jgi:DNA-binding LacI/PurR family transcriptional regulator